MSESWHPRKTEKDVAVARAGVAKYDRGWKYGAGIHKHDHSEPDKGGEVLKPEQINNIEYIDPSTDDETNLKNAIASDTRVVIGPGTITLTSPIDKTGLTNFVIEGSGWGTVLTWSQNMTAGILLSSNAEADAQSRDGVIRDLYIQGNNTIGGGHGILLGNVRNVLFDRLKIDNVGDKTVAHGGGVLRSTAQSLIPHYITYKNCWLEDGTNSDDSCTNFIGVGHRIENSYLKSHGGVSLRFYDNTYDRSFGHVAKGCIVEGANSSQPGVGINVENCVMDSCLVKNGPNTGIRIQPGGEQVNEVNEIRARKGNKIKNCVVTGNTYHGIWLRGVKDVEISGCTVYDNGRRGIYLNHDGFFTRTPAFDMSNIRISDCVVYNNGTSASPQNGIGLLNTITGQTIRDVSISDTHVFNDASPVEQDEALRTNVTAGSIGKLTVTDSELAGPSYNWNRKDEPTEWRFRDVTGYKTHNSGSASVADGGTIAHGLAETPSYVNLTASVDGHIAVATAVDATSITVGLVDDAGSAVGTAETVYWEARAR